MKGLTRSDAVKMRRHKGLTGTPMQQKSAFAAGCIPRPEEIKDPRVVKAVMRRERARATELRLPIHPEVSSLPARAQVLVWRQSGRRTIVIARELKLHPGLVAYWCRGGMMTEGEWRKHDRECVDPECRKHSHADGPSSASRS
jgi:rhodanese-related sulfurtransferase